MNRDEKGEKKRTTATGNHEVKRKQIKLIWYFCTEYNRNRFVAERTTDDRRSWERTDRCAFQFWKISKIDGKKYWWE